MTKKEQQDVLVALGLAKPSGAGSMSTVASVMGVGPSTTAVGVANFTQGMREGGAKVAGSVNKLFSAAKAVTSTTSKKF